MQRVMDTQASLEVHRHLAWNQPDSWANIVISWVSWNPTGLWLPGFLRSSEDKCQVWFIVRQVGRT